MLAAGGRGTLLRLICGAELRPFPGALVPRFPKVSAPRLPKVWLPRLAKLPALRLPKLPALGGRGTERPPDITPVRGDGELLNLPFPLVPMAARCEPCGLARFELKLPRALPLKPGLELIPARAPLLNPARFGAPMRLTTGRANARDGGAAPLPFAPTMLARVGRTPSECTAVMRLIWLGESRRLLCATGREFSSVFRETAVNPPGRCMFA